MRGGIFLITTKISSIAKSDFLKPEARPCSGQYLLVLVKTGCQTKGPDKIISSEEVTVCNF